jgi:hypothetical protein
MTNQSCDEYQKTSPVVAISYGQGGEEVTKKMSVQFIYEN